VGLMILLGIYLAGVSAVTLLLISREQREENRTMRYQLLDAERRVVRAEERLSAMPERHLLEAWDPYRGDLRAAHARILELEGRQERLARDLISGELRIVRFPQPPLKPQVRFPQPPPEKLE
jgi:hypothetical protein